MKTRTFILLLVLVAVISCTTSTEDTDQTESKNYQIVEQSKLIEDTLYYTVDYQYPFFKSENEEISVKINKLNKRIKIFLDHAEQTYWGTDTDGAVEIVKESESSGKYELMNRYEILDTTDLLISLKFETYSYALGAHGFTAIITYNFDINAGKILTLTDIVDLSEKSNLKQFNKILADSFENPYDCFTEKPKVEDNYEKFALSPEHLIIYFEAYELGAYACGSAEIKIPIEKLIDNGLWKL